MLLRFSLRKKQQLDVQPIGHGYSQPQQLFASRIQSAHWQKSTHGRYKCFASDIQTASTNVSDSNRNGEGRDGSRTGLKSNVAWQDAIAVLCTSHGQLNTLYDSFLFSMGFVNPLSPEAVRGPERESSKIRLRRVIFLLPLNPLKICLFP